MLVTPALAQEQEETTYPDDVNAQEIAEDEYTENIDIEQMYRDMPVPEFKYMHNIDPGEYQDTMYSTWSPYPLFRLTTPLFFKSIAIEPGYYLLTPREKNGKKIRYTGMISAEKVVRQALKDYKKGKDLSAPGFFSQYFRFYSKVTPTRIVMKQWTTIIGKYI